MHLFDPDGNAALSKKPFTVTVVLLSVTTYLIAFGGIWMVHYDGGSLFKKKEDKEEDKTDSNSNKNAEAVEGYVQGALHDGAESSGAKSAKENWNLDFLRRWAKGSDVSTGRKGRDSSAL